MLAFLIETFDAARLLETPLILPSGVIFGELFDCCARVSGGPAVGERRGTEVTLVVLVNCGIDCDSRILRLGEERREAAEEAVPVSE